MTYIGLDIGTSGARAVALDDQGNRIAEGTALMKSEARGEGVDATCWLAAAEGALAALPYEVRRSTRSIAVDATSGSMVLTDAEGEPVTPGLLYDSGGFEAEARAIERFAPRGFIARGPGSALARLLRLQSLVEREPAHLAHQADLIVTRLTGHGGLSDESNALKTGYDARSRCWPDWIGRTGVDAALLPQVKPVGTALASAEGPLAARLGLPSSATVVAGATDSVAAFLGAGVEAVGTAVTSLGTTLALKVLSDAQVEDAARGIYSHRVGNAWLPGGASNVGGGSLLQHFEAGDLARIAAAIDPAWEPRHPDVYPLARPGERFPRNDPLLAPVLPPLEDDARFLFELFHAIARIEREGYEALASLGAPYPTRVLTTGGGARNPVWTAIRERVLGVPVDTVERADASTGMALTAMRAVA